MNIKKLFVIGFFLYYNVREKYRIVIVKVGKIWINLSVILILIVLELVWVFFFWKRWKCMIIKKILNNNVVIVEGKSGKEFVVMGCGFVF